MFPQSEELWGLLKQVRKEGFLPYLLLVPDPLGPLAGHPHDPIHSQFEPAHMDQFIEMVHRLAFILKKILLVHGIYLGSDWAGMSVRECLCGLVSLGESLRSCESLTKRSTCTTGLSSDFAPLMFYQ